MRILGQDDRDKGTVPTEPRRVLPFGVVSVARYLTATIDTISICERVIA